jgi:hypothetical protein
VASPWTRWITRTVVAKAALVKVRSLLSIHGTIMTKGYRTRNNKRTQTFIVSRRKK